ncbi:hypothetical protein LZ198_42660 [Myxococcus sp. K15C18031901]|uniref:hypothetical protein n=1 Tax=Myxococcus dinghuensis TaxID=2906761 RepID=UPI0020A70F59|nr:hypothetical protein [Myxococcus dinghuensis]MCP3105568.1 hypothetical protein [Myxococcus dinghuensis]
MGLMDAPDPMEELERQLISDTVRNWRKLEFIAAQLTKRGIKSPVTRKDVTKTDVSRDFHTAGIKMWEASEGRITDEMLQEFERQSAKAAGSAKKKSVLKKGGGR